MPLLTKGQLRYACVLAMKETDWLKRSLFLEQADRKAYAALFHGEYDWVLARIPDRYAKDLEVHLLYLREE